jgi:hypothetical protein
MKISGRITKFFPAGYGYIQVKQGTRTSRYFLHVSNIISLAEGLDEPVVGCEVTFEPTNDFKRHPKDIPSAVDAEVGPAPSPDSEVLRARSGKTGGV